MDIIRLFKKDPNVLFIARDGRLMKPLHMASVNSDIVEVMVTEKERALFRRDGTRLRDLQCEDDSLDIVGSYPIYTEFAVGVYQTRDGHRAEVLTNVVESHEAYPYTDHPLIGFIIINGEPLPMNWTTDGYRYCEDDPDKLDLMG